MFPEEDDHGACVDRLRDTFVASVIGTNSRIEMKLGEGDWTVLFSGRPAAYLCDGIQPRCRTGSHWASYAAQ